MNTTYQWLIERGQPEGQSPTVWLEHSAWHPAGDKHWTTTAHDAAMFPTKGAAEVYIDQNMLAPARAVEHGFMSREQPDYRVFYEWCVENAPRVVELCPYKFSQPGETG